MKQIQTNWLDYWFVPRMTIVRVKNADYIPTVKAIQESGDWISAVAVERDGYTLTVYRKKPHDNTKETEKGADSR